MSESPDERIALEWFLRGVDTDLALPALALEDPVVDFGEVERDSSYSLLLPFTNSTRGYLLVAAASIVPWLQVETDYVGCYAGERGQIQLTLDTERMPEGMHKREALALAWEDQQQRVPVQMKVIWPPGGRLEPAQANLGLFWEGQPASTYELILDNTGGSEWVGRLMSTDRWLSLQSDTFRIPTQVRARAPVAIYPQHLRLGEKNKGVISLVSNGGSQVATIEAVLARPWYAGKGRLRRWLAFAAPALLSVAGFVFGVSRLSEVVSPSFSPTLQQSMPAVMGLVAWLLAMLMAAVFIPALDEIEDFHHGGDLALDIPAFQFDWRRAWPQLALYMLLGIVIGQRFGVFTQNGAALKGAYTLLGLLLGGLAGLGILGGSSDQIRGTKPLSGLDWLVRRPLVLALLRTVVVSLSLAILAQMFRTSLPQLSRMLTPMSVLFGFILTSDGYPYLPKRVQEVLAWLRPAFRALSLGLVLQGALILLLKLNPDAWSIVGLQALLLGLVSLAALLGGALLGVITQDEVGFEWKQALKHVAPLAMILMLVAAVLYVVFNVILTLFFGGAARWLVYLLNLAALSVLALGLTGRSRLVQQYLDRIVTWSKGRIKDVPTQAPDWMLSGAEPMRWFSGKTVVSAADPFILATAILISVLLAPVWGRLLGALLWLIVLVGIAAGAFWWWRRQNQTSAPWERRQ